MGIFMMFLGFLLIILGLPASIVTTIVFTVKKRKVLVPAICIPASIFVGFVFLCIGGCLYGQTDEYKQSEIEREQSELAQLKEEDVFPAETQEKTETSDSEISETTTQETKQEPTYEFTYQKMDVKYLKHEIMVDSVDQTVLVVYYEFTNNSGENKTFDYSFSDTCFQNGVEIERSWWHANEESKNSGKEIKSGTTITVASSFVLGDSRDNVEIEITPWISFTDKVLLELELELE